MTDVIVHPVYSNHSSHPVCDIHFWRDAWKLLADANYNHGYVIDKFLTKTNQQVELLGPEEKLLEAEKKFVYELRLLQDVLKQQKERILRDGSQYYELEKSIKRHEDDPDLRLAKLNMSLTQARNKLDAQTGLVSKCKQEYHKAMWHVEKEGIKGMLTDKETHINEMKKYLDDLRNKADNQHEKYNKHLDKWHVKLDMTKQLSTDYETSFVTREMTRAALVLHNLQNSVDLTSNGNFTKQDCLFDDVDAESIIRDKLIKKVSVDIPVFEPYKEERGKKKMYARARASVKTDTDRSTEVVTEQEHGHQTNTDDRQRQRLKTNKKLKKVKLLFLTTTNYTKEEVNQLTLRVGDYVRQILPANDDGYAFGQVVHGKIRRKKKKGFYPVCHVTAVNPEELEINIDDISDYSDDDQIEVKKEVRKPRNSNIKKSPEVVDAKDNGQTPGHSKASSKLEVTEENDDKAKEIKKRRKIFTAIANSNFVRKLKGSKTSNGTEDDVPKDMPTNQHAGQNDDVAHESRHSPRRAVTNGPKYAWGNPGEDEKDNVAADSVAQEVAAIDKAARARRRAARAAARADREESSGKSPDVVDDSEKEVAAIDKAARARRRAARAAARADREESSGKSHDVVDDSEQARQRDARKRRRERKERSKVVEVKPYTG